MKNLLLITLLITLSQLSLAATDFDGNCRSAYHDIICLRFDDARKKIDLEKAINPANTIPYLLDNYIDFITVMVGEEEKDLEQMRQNRDFRLQHLVNGDSKSPWYLYSQADIYLQWGFARIKFGEYVSAGLDINWAFRLLEDNEHKFPDFTPNKIRLGLLHALVGTVPDKYRWAISALEFQGTIPQGIRELNIAFTECQANKQFGFLLPEVTFILSFVTINLSGDKEATLRFATSFNTPALSLLVTQSPLICYTLANLKMKSANNDEAIILLSNCPRGSGYYPFDYLDYELGIAKLNRLDPDAYLPLMRFVAGFHGRNYIRSAYEHLAWHYLIHNNSEKYWFYLNRIQLRGFSMVDNDRQALKNSQKQEIPDPSLLKARLLFDGGYYTKALAELSHISISVTGSKLKLEYTYRTARVYDEWGKTDDAVSWYNKTIELGFNDPSYYAANSALHLGLIYENASKYTLAKLNYEKCIEMNFDEFHFSITQKAKSGLNRIKNR